MKRPLVSTHIRTEFGDVKDDASFYDVSGADRDMTFVPGFSDMRRKRDLALADVASGKKLRHEVNIEALPVNLRWTRVSTLNGAPDGRKLIASSTMGYKAVHKDQVGKEAWLTALPAGATIDADGSIRKGDTILTVASGADAGKNAARRAAQTRRLVSEASANAQGLLGQRKAGTDAYVRKEG